MDSGKPTVGAAAPIGNTLERTMTVQAAAPPTYEVAPALHASETAALPTMAYTAYSSTTPEVVEAASIHKKQQEDLEATGTSELRGCTYTLCGKEREWKHRGGGWMCCCLFGGIIVLAVGVLAAVVFGISVGVEKGLTGEYFWTPGHSSLFRICESSSTSSKPFQLHTCNVFRPNHPVDAPPLHSFVESVRSWESSGHATQGRAVRIESYRLDSLLLNEGLKCSPSSTNVPQTGIGALDARAQLVIGNVGQAYFAQKMAIACNYDRMGRNVQTWCARYGDGGQLSAGKPHPLSINQIFTKHFAMNCTWET